MAPIPFEASRLKIWRAKQHLESLTREIRTYLARKPAYTNIRQADEKPAGMVAYETFLTEPIPVDLAPIVGDIVHNLRTSLDLLASELVRMNGKSDDGVYFPFAKDVKELEAAIKDKKVNRASADVVDLIRSFEPYIGGNADLRGIHDLDIIDKHQALIPAAGRIKVPSSHTDDQTFPSSGVQFSRLDKTGAEQVGQLQKGYTRASNWPVGKNLPVRFDLTLPGEMPFASQELISTFERLVQEFSGVIDAFEAHCFGTVTKELPWVQSSDRKGLKSWLRVLCCRIHGVQSSI